MPLTHHIASGEPHPRDNEVLLCAVTESAGLSLIRWKWDPTGAKKKKPNYVILCVVKIDFYLISSRTNIGLEYTYETHLHLSLIIVEHAYSVMYGDAYDVAEKKRSFISAFLPCNLITVETRRLFFPHEPSQFLPPPLSHYVIRYGRWKLINFSCDIASSMSVGGTQWNFYRVVDPECFQADGFAK